MQVLCTVAMLLFYKWQQVVIFYEFALSAKYIPPFFFDLKGFSRSRDMEGLLLCVFTVYAQQAILPLFS